MAVPLTALRRTVAIAFAAALGGATLHANAQPDRLTLSQRELEYDVKCQFLGHFTAFIEWPPSVFRTPDAPFRVCILGADPFGPALDQRLGAEQVNGRRVTVTRIKTEAAAATCQVVFVAGADPARTAALHKATHDLPVLIVTDTVRLLDQCAAIAFVMEGGRVRFDVNLTAIAGRGLKANPRLLRVARDATDRVAHCD